MMVVAGLLMIGLLWIGMRPRAMVPGRLQSAAETGLRDRHVDVRRTIGPEGRKFFPFVFTLFFFILFGNLLGVFPYFFTFTSHIAVTLALSLLVLVLVTVVALREHGWHFFSYFVPQGVPVALAPLLVADRDPVLPVAHHLPVGPSVRQHDGRPRHAGGVRRLRR